MYNKNDRPGGTLLLSSSAEDSEDESPPQEGEEEGKRITNNGTHPATLTPPHHSHLPSLPTPSQPSTTQLRPFRHRRGAFDEGEYVTKEEGSG